MDLVPSLQVARVGWNGAKNMAREHLYFRFHNGMNAKNSPNRDQLYQAENAKREDVYTTCVPET